MIERMESLMLECKSQIAVDGDRVWKECYAALQNAVAYQKAKQDAAMRKAYGPPSGSKG